MTVHAVEENGSLRPQPVQNALSAEKVHAVLLDRKNRFAFIPHTGPNAIFQFAFNAATGELTPGDPAWLATPENTGPRHIVFHPRLDIAYVSNEQGGSATAYRLDKASGSLQATQTITTLPSGFSERSDVKFVVVKTASSFQLFNPLNQRTSQCSSGAASFSSPSLS